ncbi:MAG: SagB/ThcOx family dehydrogenase [Edaphobacter sp.]
MTRSSTVLNRPFTKSRLLAKRRLLARVNRKHQTSPVQWRRATSIFSYWTEGQFIVENYRTKNVLSANPVTARVLHLFSDWRSLDEVCRELPEYNSRSIRRSVIQLARNGLLLPKDSSQDKEDQQFLESWSSWTPHAAILHFGTKNMPYTTSDQETTKRLQSYLEQSAQPDSSKSLSRKINSQTTPLPALTSTNSDFFSVLLRRRTHREFSSTPLDLERLSAMLHYTWGVTGFINNWLLGPLPLKTSPSAGARHPCEVYVVSLRVSGLPRGLYHYAADRHILERISTEISREKASEYCAGQAWVEGAAALFLTTAVFPRSMWKYRFSRAYRTVVADAAHLCQTFCLVATHLGLAPFCTMALKETVIERDLGIDGITESILYVAGVGLPAQQPST